MPLPIVAPAPIVAAHVEHFRDLFENHCQFEHFQRRFVILTPPAMKAHPEPYAAILRN